MEVLQSIGVGEPHSQACGQLLPDAWRGLTSLNICVVRVRRRQHSGEP